MGEWQIEIGLDMNATEKIILVRSASAFYNLPQYFLPVPYLILCLNKETCEFQFQMDI